MQLESLLGHSSELVRIIQKSSQPADTIASEYFRSKKYIGASDRRFISGLVFHTLRTRSLCEAVASHEGMTDIVHASHALMEKGLDGLGSWTSELPEHVRVCTQDWLLERTRIRWSDAAAVWQSMTSAAPLVLRVNLRRATRDRVLQHLHSENIDAIAGQLSPAAVIVNQRINLLQHPLYKGGIVEIQDEGEVRPRGADDRLFQRVQETRLAAPGITLVGAGRIHEPVAQNGAPLRQRGTDDLLEMLLTRRVIEERL